MGELPLIVSVLVWGLDDDINTLRMSAIPSLSNQSGLLFPVSSSPFAQSCVIHGTKNTFCELIHCFTESLSNAT